MFTRPGNCSLDAADWQKFIAKRKILPVLSQPWAEQSPRGQLRTSWKMCLRLEKKIRKILLWTAGIPQHMGYYGSVGVFGTHNWDGWYFVGVPKVMKLWFLGWVVGLVGWVGWVGLGWVVGWLVGWSCCVVTHNHILAIKNALVG